MYMAGFVIDTMKPQNTLNRTLNTSQDSISFLGRESISFAIFRCPLCFTFMLPLKIFIATRLLCQFSSFVALNS